MKSNILNRRDLMTAQTLFRAAYFNSRKWSDTVKDAIAKYGERPQGGFISGIYSEHFPQLVQDQLKALAKEVSRYSNLAWKAFPPRIRHHTKMKLKQAVIDRDGKGHYG